MAQENSFNDIWSEKKAAWYDQALSYSTYPHQAVEVISRRLAGINSLLDVGAGTGSLSLPLAKILKKVTCLEPSPSMAKILENKARRQSLDNIKIVNSSWEKAKISPHDAILVASVPGVLKDVKGFLAEAAPLVKKSFFLISGVGREGHKFFFDELYPLLSHKEFKKGGDYLDLYVALHSLGICADVEIFPYRFDQKFTGLNEAVDFWKEHLNIKADQHDAVLKDFLAKRLTATKRGYVHKIRKRSALITWRV